jgi:hypothetical protein
VIFYVTRLGIELRKKAPLRVHSGNDKRLVGAKIIVFEIQVMVNQGGTKIRVVTHSITAHPRIYKGKSKEKQKEKKPRIRRDHPGA